MNPEPGLRIGPYSLVEPIGEGGMGVVWRARDTSLDRDVAIKFLPAAFARDPERLARFQREAKAVAALSHPGILAIYGFGEHEGSAYAVTELLEGQTLRGALAAGPLAPSRARDIARQAARALAASHDRGIVHRDLKPENVFLTRDGHVKILDFGLAAYLDPVVPPDTPSGAAPTPTRTSLTTPGTVLGTIDYLSPEQVRGSAADARSDIFSFGSMLFEMLAGQRPFRRATAAETMTAILRESPPAAPGASPALEGIVSRCLAKSPEDRFASARDLASALDSSADAVLRPWRARLLPAALVTVAVVVAVTAFWVSKERVPRDGRGSPSAGHPASLSTIGEAPSPDAEANEYFEKGLLFLRAQLDIPRAQKMLEHAIALDPSFGSARAMRALTNVIAVHEGFSNDAGLIYSSERDVRDLLGQQRDLASAHATLGAALLYLNRKEQARQELETASRLNPQTQASIAWMTIDDRHSGRFEAAESRVRRILQAVPLFWAARVLLSDVLFDEGRIDEAHREIEKVFEQDPANLGAVRAMARIHIYEGDTRGARAMLEGISAETHPNYRVHLVRALLLSREGKVEAAMGALDAETLKYAGIAMFAPAQVAEVYALCARTGDALDWLDRAARNGDERSEWFRRDVLLANIQAQPRFRLILESIERGRPEQRSPRGAG